MWLMRLRFVDHRRRAGFSLSGETRPAPPPPGRGALETTKTPSQSKIRAERAISPMLVCGRRLEVKAAGWRAAGLRAAQAVTQGPREPPPADAGCERRGRGAG